MIGFNKRTMIGSIRSLQDISFRSWCTDTTYFIPNKSSTVCPCTLVHMCARMWTESPNNPTCLAASSTANYDAVKNPMRGFFFFWCITYGRSVNTSSWTSCLQMVIQMKPRACGALLTDNEGTHGKTTDEIRSCHILSIPAALRGLGLACVVSVLPCLRAAAAVCAPSSPLMFYTGCTAEPQISCLVPSRRSSGQLH